MSTPPELVTRSLEQLVYVSDDPCGMIGAIEAEDILIQARRNNARDGVTGALALVSGHFVQILEGTPDRLDLLLERLSRDDRHTNLIVLDRRPIVVRDFVGWDMVSPRLAPAELAHVLVLLSEDEISLDRFVDILAQAVSRQADILMEYGFIPSRTSTDGSASHS